MDGPVTPTGAVEEMQGWSAETLIQELEHPWAIAWLPDADYALITERPGRLRVAQIQDGNYELRDQAVQGLPEVYAHGQGGLMDVVLHPDFAENRWVYLTLTQGKKSSNYTVLARGRLSDDLTTLEDAQVLWEVSQRKPHGQHFGSRLLWLPDGTLLIAIGDGGNPPVNIDGTLTRSMVQDLSKDLGKVHRLDENGQPVGDNPFVDKPDAVDSVYTYGHRNIQGLAIDPDTGKVYATEHGARGGDELNQIKPGQNYGWPLVTWSVEYSGKPITAKRTMPGVTDPMVVWTPVLAACGLAFYSGDVYPDWKGDLFAGGLVSKQVRYVDLDEKGRAVGQRTLRFDQRVRDVRQGPDGFLYVLTESQAPDGKLHRIVLEE